MVRIALGALIVGYLPGALFFRVPLLDRSRRSQLAAEERLFWAVMLSAAWSLATVLALALAHVYSFERLLAINLSIAALIGLASRQHLRYSEPAPRVTWSALVPLTIAALGASLY